MSYCPNCGRQILDEKLGCPVCGMNRNEQKFDNQDTNNADEQNTTEKVKEFSVEDENGNFEKFTSDDNGNVHINHKIPEKTIPTVLKVLAVLGIIFVGGFGNIAGIIAGIALLKSPVADNRKFGKTLIIISCVMLVIWFLCCIIGGFFGLLGNITYEIFDTNYIDVPVEIMGEL